MWAKLKQGLTFSSASDVVEQPYVTPDMYKTDVTYSNIGDVPSGFFPYKGKITEIYARPFTIRELPLIHRACNSQNAMDHLIRAVDSCISVPAAELTDGDFEFVMAWLRESSYPSGPTFVRWDCNNLVMRDELDDIIEGVNEEDMEMQGLHYDKCGRENNELVHQTEMRFVSLDDDFPGLPDFMDFPRIASQKELSEIKKMSVEDVKMAEYARWVRAGTSLHDKIAELDKLSVDQFVELMRLSKACHHGVYENLHLRCRSCNSRPSYRNPLQYTKFFADNTDQNVMDIQYSLLSHFSLQPDANMPVKLLLYHNSCLAKDLQKEAEKNALRPKAPLR